MSTASCAKCKIMAISNQKGGVGKSTVAVNLGIGLAREGKKVLIIDADAQGSATISLGYKKPDEMEISLATILTAIINGEDFDPFEGILHNEEGVDLIPGNIELSGLEVALISVMSRERILKEYLGMIKSQYDYILIDCAPSLGMMTINALATSTSVLIPVQAAYLSVKGLQELMNTIFKVKKRLNKQLYIEGILISMVDLRTNYAKEIVKQLEDGYEGSIKILDTKIPSSVKAAEASAMGISVYKHVPNCKVTESFTHLTKEILSYEI